jgi:hypothetical protein
MAYESSRLSSFPLSVPVPPYNQVHKAEPPATNLVSRRTLLVIVELGAGFQSGFRASRVSLRLVRGRHVCFRSCLRAGDLGYSVDSFAVRAGGTAGHDGETRAIADVLRPRGLDDKCTHCPRIAPCHPGSTDQNLGLAIDVARVPGHRQRRHRRRPRGEDASGGELNFAAGIVLCVPHWRDSA